MDAEELINILRAYNPKTQIAIYIDEICGHENDLKIEIDYKENEPNSSIGKNLEEKFLSIKSADD